MSLALEGESLTTQQLIAIHNERTKLLANGLDRASTAAVAGGIFTPLGGFLYNLGGAPPPGGALTVAAIMYVALFVGVALHFAARRVLGRLR